MKKIALSLVLAFMLFSCASVPTEIKNTTFPGFFGEETREEFYKTAGRFEANFEDVAVPYFYYSGENGTEWMHIFPEDAVPVLISDPRNPESKEFIYVKNPDAFLFLRKLTAGHKLTVTAYHKKRTELISMIGLIPITQQMNDPIVMEIIPEEKEIVEATGETVSVDFTTLFFDVVPHLENYIASKIAFEGVYLPGQRNLSLNAVVQDAVIDGRQKISVAASMDTIQNKVSVFIDENQERLLFDKPLGTKVKVVCSVGKTYVREEIPDLFYNRLNFMRHKIYDKTAWFFILDSIEIIE